MAAPVPEEKSTAAQRIGGGDTAGSAGGKVHPPRTRPEAPQPFETRRLSQMLREEEGVYQVQETRQMELFEEKLLTKEAVQSYGSWDRFLTPIGWRSMKTSCFLSISMRLMKR